jgi:hypothetical protein
MVFIDFLRRLVWDWGRKVYLIVDRHPVHTSRKVRGGWSATRPRFG